MNPIERVTVEVLFEIPALKVALKVETLTTRFNSRWIPTDLEDCNYGASPERQNMDQWQAYI